MTLIREPIFGGGTHSVLSQQVQSSGTQLSYVVPANTLSADGDMLRVTCTGLNWSTLGPVNVRYGGTLIINSNLDTTSINFGLWATIQRSGASQQRCFTYAADGSVAGGVSHFGGATRTANNAAAQTLQVEILGSGSSGVLWTMTVELIKA